MQKLNWNKWAGIDNIPINKNLLVQIENYDDKDKDDLRTAVFTKKRGVVIGSINGAYWFDQKILRWASLEGVL